MPFRLDRELYLTEDKKTVVEANDPRARYVLGVEGSEIPDEQAEELGLTKASKVTKPLAVEAAGVIAEVDPEAAPTEDEPKGKQPAPNKAAEAKANKGK